jgi:hypothetical protein
VLTWQWVTDPTKAPVSVRIAAPLGSHSGERSPLSFQFLPDLSCVPLPVRASRVGISPTILTGQGTTDMFSRKQDGEVRTGISNVRETLLAIAMSGEENQGIARDLKVLCDDFDADNDALTAALSGCADDPVTKQLHKLDDTIVVLTVAQAKVRDAEVRLAKAKEYASQCEAEEGSLREQKKARKDEFGADVRMFVAEHGL